MIVPLFNIPVYYNHNKIDLSQSLDYVENLEYFRNSSNDGAESKSKKVLNHESLSPIRNLIVKNIKNYLDLLSVSDSVDFSITRSWVMKHEEGDYSPNHYHSNSLLSGIIYLKCDEDSGKITFKTPNMSIFPSALEISFNEWNIYNSRNWSFQPSVGDVILFPSFLEHSVESSKSKEERYCISFDTFINGRLGYFEMNRLHINSY